MARGELLEFYDEYSDQYRELLDEVGSRPRPASLPTSVRRMPKCCLGRKRLT